MLINLIFLSLKKNLSYMHMTVDQLIGKGKKKKRSKLQFTFLSQLSSFPLEGFHYFMENSYVYMMSKKGIKIKKGIIMEISFTTRE